MQQQNYTKQAAETIIQCYKETVEIANLRKKEPKSDEETNDDVQNDSIGQTGKPILPKENNNSGSKPIPWTFPIGEKTVSLTIIGGKPYQDEMDSLISILQAFKQTLPIKKEEPKE